MIKQGIEGLVHASQISHNR